MSQDWGLAPDEPKQKPKSELDKLLIGIFFAVGTAGIIAFKTFDAQLAGLGVPSLLAVCWAIAVMLAYAWVVYRSRKFRLREDMSGDNIYYLGFLFTLVSLAVSLAQFEGAADVASVINAFGIGVASTIVGLILRIIFNQLREDPIEVEQEIRLELADAAGSVKKTLFEVANGMNAFRISVQQTLDETVRSVQAKTIEAGEAAASELKAGAGALSSEIKAALSDLQSHARRFGKSTGSIADALEQHAQHLDAIGKAAEGIQGQVKALASVAGEVERELRARAQQAAAESQARVDLTDLASKTSAGLVDLNELVEKMNGSLRNAAGAFDRFTNGVGDLTSTAQRHVAALAEELEHARGYTNQVHNGLVAVTEDLIRRAEASPLPAGISPAPERVEERAT